MEARRWRGGILALMLIGLAGCSPKSALGAGPAAPALPQITLGLIGAAPGPGSVEGSYTGQAAQLAVDEINTAGGVVWHGQHYDLRLAYAGWPDVRGEATNLLFGTPAPVALLGPDESDAAAQVAPVAASAGVALLTTATGDALTATANTVVRLRPPAAWFARSLTTYLLDHLGAKSLAIATSADAYGQAGDASVTAELAARGAGPTLHVSLAPGLIDPAAAVNAIILARADSVICVATEADAATLLLGLRAAGWTGLFAQSDLDADFLALAGADGVGTVGIVSWSGASANPASASFAAAYQRRFGRQPDAHSAAMYDAVRLVAAGLAAVGPNHAALLGYLRQLTTFAGTQGTLGVGTGQAVLGAVADINLNTQMVRVTATGLTILP